MLGVASPVNKRSGKPPANRTRYGWPIHAVVDDEIYAWLQKQKTDGVSVSHTIVVALKRMMGKAGAKN